MLKVRSQHPDLEDYNPYGYDSPYYEGRAAQELAQDDFINESRDRSHALDRVRILDDISLGRLLSDEDYVELFSYFPWGTDYGGQTWAEVAKANIRLKQLVTQGYNVDTGEASVWIDHVFDLTHNTDSLFSKMPVRVRNWLMVGLELKRHATPFKLLPFASPEVSQLMREYMRLTGGVGKYQEETAQYTKLKSEKITDKLVQLYNHKIYDYSPADLVRELENYGLSPIDFADSPFYSLVYLTKYFWDRKGGEWFWFIGLWQSLHGTGAALKHSLLSLPFEHIDPSIKGYLVSLIRFFMQRFSQDILADLQSLIEKRESTEQFKGWSRALGIDEINKMRRNAFTDFLVKMAMLEKSTFFDFYLLNYINPEAMYPDQAQQVIFLRKHVMIEIMEEMIEYIDVSLLEEALHVNDQFALDYSYIDRYEQRVTKAEEAGEQEEKMRQEGMFAEEAEKQREEEMFVHPLQVGFSHNWLRKISQSIPPNYLAVGHGYDYSGGEVKEIGIRNTLLWWWENDQIQTEDAINTTHPLVGNDFALGRIEMDRKIGSVYFAAISDAFKKMIIEALVNEFRGIKFYVYDSRGAHALQDYWNELR